MKFTCTKTELAGAVAVTGRAVAAKSTIPALEGMLIRAESDGLQLTAYNLELGITCSVFASVTEPGGIIVNAKTFTDIVRRLPNDSVFFETDDDLHITLRCGLSRFDLSGMNAAEFPELPTIDREHAFSLKADMLKSMISETVFAVAVSETRPAQMGVLFDVGNGLLRTVATDNYRLAFREEPLAGESDDCSFIVPAATLREIEKILSDQIESVELQFSKKHIAFTAGNVVLVSRLLDGQFFKYQNSIAYRPDNSVVVNVSQLAECVNRVSILAEERQKLSIKCRFEGGRIRLSYISANAKAYDECSYEGDCEATDISVSDRYITDALRSVSEEKVRIEFNGPTTPIVIRPENGSEFFHMIAVVRPT